MMTRRVKSLLAKKRLTVIRDCGDIIYTAPGDASPPPTTLDIRSKKSGALLARLDMEGFSIKCNWCHKVQVIGWEQLKQMQEQVQKESTDDLLPIYCPNCIQKQLDA
jgi:hypothetical protein